MRCTACSPNKGAEAVVSTCFSAGREGTPAWRLHSRGTTTAGARHCTSLTYSGRRPNQYMQGFKPRAVGRARESDKTRSENLRSPSPPPAVRASRHHTHGRATLPVSRQAPSPASMSSPSEQVEKILKFFRFLREENTLSFLRLFFHRPTRHARLPASTLTISDVPSIGAGRKNFKVFPFP